MLSKLEDEYGVVLPLADLLLSDPYKELIGGVTYGRYLGIHEAAGDHRGRDLLPLRKHLLSQPRSVDIVV